MTNRRSVNDDVVIINPLFPIPEGLRDFTYEDREFAFDPDTDKYENDTDDVSVGSEDGEEEEPEAVPAVPKTFSIIKQTIRTKADGSQVVDLTVEVEAVKGAEKYEFRLTNKDTGKSTVV